MKETMFRIIELPTHQILLSKDFDNDDDNEEAPELLVLTFFLEGIKVSQKFAYSEKEKRDKYFDEFSDETAQKVLDSAIKIFED